MLLWLKSGLNRSSSEVCEEDNKMIEVDSLRRPFHIGK